MKSDKCTPTVKFVKLNACDKDMIPFYGQARLCPTNLSRLATPLTMKSYLAAVRHEQISMGLGDPHTAQMPQLEYVLKGAKRLATFETCKRLPITLSIVQQIKKVWKESIRS